MGYTHGKGGSLRTGIVFALPDGHLAGNKNGHSPTGGIYELFYRSGIPIHNDCGGFLQPKGDGATACISGMEELGPVRIHRPQAIAKYIHDGVYHAGITGSDCIFDAYTNGKGPRFVVDGEPNPALLDFDGHRQVTEEFLAQNGMELVLPIPIRPSLAGFAFPRELTYPLSNGTKRRIETPDDMRRYAEFHSKEYGRRAVMGAEYIRYAGGVLAAGRMSKLYDVEPSGGSTETLLRTVADGVMETIETGAGLKRVEANLVHPCISVHHPLMVMRKDAPEIVKENIHVLRDVLADGLGKMQCANSEAFHIKLDYDAVGWDGHAQKLPESLERMRLVKC